MKPSLPIAPDDTIRTLDKMEEPDSTGTQGRWLDVPRLPEYNGLADSWLWSGRTSAAMLHNYYCKALGKTSEYIGHKTGKPGPGSAGKYADNLRWVGGSNADAIAGVCDNGRCDLSQLFDKMGWKLQEGYLQKSPKEAISTERAEVEKRFSPIIDALNANNPVLIYTRLATSKNGGHVVVISGWKKQDGDLWLRITDPTNPNVELLGEGNLQLVQQKPSSFSEYWVRAKRLLEAHPKREGKRLLSYIEIDKIGRYFYVTDQKVDDDKEVVHKLDRTGASGGKKDERKEGEGPRPVSGSVSLSFAINKSQAVTAGALQSLYHASERGRHGAFPLGTAGQFHSGTDLMVERGKPICAIARGEVVAARIGVGHGEHPWGDTGFVLLRHPLDGGKSVFSLFVHLQREPLHPDRTHAGWLRRLLIDAPEGGKPKWRVMADAPTWKDEDKGKFSPVNVQNDKLLPPGVYEEEERTGEDNGLYLKLKGQWIKVTQDGASQVKELSAWADFDLEAAAKKNQALAALKDGKVAILDADKKDGKRRWTVEAGEPIGVAGDYLGSPLVHWSVFCKDAVFPTGSLPEKEFGPKDEVKLSELELREERGDVKHTQKLIEALDPHKKSIGKMPHAIPMPGEVQHFYRTPAECWRSRYLAVKGLTEFALDVDKFLQQERHKSHTEKERDEFKKNAQAFLFWKDLAQADEFPQDGNAIFVHPVTALRLMASLTAPREAKGGKKIEKDDRLHPHEDVTVRLRDANGPIAEAKVQVKVDGTVVFEGTTDAAGALLVPIKAVEEKEIEICVDQSLVGEGELVVAANDAKAPPTLMPGDAPGKQTFNGTDLVPDPRLRLPMRVKKGQSPDFFASWDASKLEPSGKKLASLNEGEPIHVERIVFRREDGQYEGLQAFRGKQLGYLWSIRKGEEILEPQPAGEQKTEEKEKRILASWSQRTAHINDHPVLAGRVLNIEEGSELEVTFCAILGIGAPEHDQELHFEKVKVAMSGFAVAFDPHALTTDHDLLYSPRPVYGKFKAGDQLISLRDQAITVYDQTKLQERPPPPPEGTGKAPQENNGRTAQEKAS
jgi:murein DD-endopeptidase MepM/ murein hydrolase activator NlpD